MRSGRLDFGPALREFCKGWKIGNMDGARRDGSESCLLSRIRCADREMGGIYFYDDTFYFKSNK